MPCPYSRCQLFRRKKKQFAQASGMLPTDWHAMPHALQDDDAER